MKRFTKRVLGLTSFTGVEMILDLFLIELELSCAAHLCMATRPTTVIW